MTGTLPVFQPMTALLVIHLIHQPLQRLSLARLVTAAIVPRKLAMLYALFLCYQRERNLTGWPHTVLSGESNGREPEALPHQQNTPHAL
jgi:hypothetical protein